MFKYKYMENNSEFNLYTTKSGNNIMKITGGSKEKSNNNTNDDRIKRLKEKIKTLERELKKLEN